MNWIWMILYGFVAGLAEFLPVSSHAHQTLVSKVFNLESVAPLRVFLIRGASLAALLVSCRRELGHLLRDYRLSRIPRRRRVRPVDIRNIATFRLLIAAAVPLVIGLFFTGKANALVNNLAVLSVFLLLNGIFLYIPQHVSSGNKDGRMLTPIDGVAIGLGGALSAFPGISRMGTVHFAASLRGADRNYAIHFSLLLSIPALIVMLILDAVNVFSGIEKLTFLTVLQYGLSMGAAYYGATLSISMIRSLAVRTGFDSFAYYCWGLSLISVILYLTT